MGCATEDGCTKGEMTTRQRIHKYAMAAPTVPEIAATEALRVSEDVLVNNSQGAPPARAKSAGQLLAIRVFLATYEPSNYGETLEIELERGATFGSPLKKGGT